MSREPKESKTIPKTGMVRSDAKACLVEATDKAQLGNISADIVFLLKRQNYTPKDLEVMRDELPEELFSAFDWHLSELGLEELFESEFFLSQEYEAYLAEKMENFYPAQLFVARLVEIDALIKFSLPLLSIIQQYVSDGLTERQNLFFWLTKSPKFKLGINDLTTTPDTFLTHGIRNHILRTHGIRNYIQREVSALVRINNTVDITSFWLSLLTTRYFSIMRFRTIFRVHNLRYNADILCTAIYFSRSLEEIKFLYEHTIDPSAEDPRALSTETFFKSRPLILATANSAIVDFLLNDKRIRKTINARDSGGKFALYSAAQRLNFNVIKRLVDAKADPTLKFLNLTPLECVEEQIKQRDYEPGMMTQANDQNVLRLLRQAVPKWQRNQYVMAQFRMIQQQGSGYSSAQKEICRDYFSYQFADFESYSEIYLAYKAHNGANYVIEERASIFNLSNCTRTKRHLISEALQAVIRLAEDKIIPTPGDLINIRPIIADGKAAKNEDLDKLITKVLALIPSLKADKVEHHSLAAPSQISII